MHRRARFARCSQVWRFSSAVWRHRAPPSRFLVFRRGLPPIFLTSFRWFTYVHRNDVFPLRVVRVESVIGVAPGGPHCRGVSRPSLGVPGGTRCLIFSRGHHYRWDPWSVVASLLTCAQESTGLPGVPRCGARCGATGLPQVAFWSRSGGDFLLSVPGGPPIFFSHRSDGS